MAMQGGNGEGSGNLFADFGTAQEQQAEDDLFAGFPTRRSRAARGEPGESIPEVVGGVELTQAERIALERAENEDETRRVIAGIAGRAAGENDGPIQTFVRSVGTGLFGVGELAARAGTALRNLVNAEDEADLSADEIRIAQREQRRAQERSRPGTAIAGQLAGGIIGGGGAARGAGAVASQLARQGGRAAQVGRAAQAATQLQAGQRARNVGRLAGAGAAEGAVAGQVLEGDPTTGAVTGAVAAPAVGTALRGTTMAARRLLESDNARGLRIIASRVGEPVEDLAQRFVDFQARTGRTPRLVEILGENAAEDIGEVARRSRGASQVMQQAREEAVQDLPRSLSRNIEGSRAARTEAEGRRVRDALTDRAIQPIADRPVVFEPEDAQNILADPDLTAALPSTLRRTVRSRLGAAADEGGNIDQPVTFTIREVDNIRRALGTRARQVGSEQTIGELRNQVRDIASAQVPEFGRALQQFAARDEAAEGLARGRDVLTQPVREFRDAQRLSPTPQRAAGQRVGARRALADRAQEGPAEAAELARQLGGDEPAGTQARVRTVLRPQEAEQLQRAAQSEFTAAQRVEQATPRSRPRGGTQAAEAFRDAIAAAVVAGGQSGGAFQTEFARRMISRFSIPERSAVAMARAVTDPARTDEVIRMLRQLGANEDEITELVQGAAQSAGVAASVEATENGG